MSRPRARSRNSARAVRKMIGISVVRSSSSTRTVVIRAVPYPSVSALIPRRPQLEDERRPLAFARVDSDPAAHGGDETFGEEEAEPRRAGADGPGCGRVAAIELAEDALLLGMRDADPLVLHAHLDRVLAATRGDRDGAAGGRVADGIVEQVEQDLGQLFPVGLRRQRLGVELDDQAGAGAPVGSFRRAYGLV